ncbi:glucose-6-phosphatase 2 [Bacillus rossius redtenbacheri]|uniref:glucose-6-phosphatase 2 n=1 Tax=Bacillus rossius redtenbacheri TaxID=93214 RepID=UPI002FDD68B1
MGILLEELNRIGVIVIKYLQTVFPGGDWFFLGVSRASDPLSVFLYVVPVVAGLQVSLGADMLVATALAEWLNTLLKWLLMEHRPYWWVRETALYGGPERAPSLRQTPLTCETGPGCPSGHVMGYAAVAYLLASSLSEGVPRSLARGVWALYWGTVLLVALSRLYVATHFPHQCALGALGGLAVAWLLAGRDWHRTPRRAALLGALGLCLVPVAAYWLQKLLGVDPQWSVRLAFKWCEHPEFLHVNTTPLFSLVRSCGALVGVALCCPLVFRLRQSGGRAVRLIGSLLVAAIFQYATQLVPTHDAALFYTVQLILHVAQPCLLLLAAPRIASLLRA